MKARARRTDPETSHEAASGVEWDGSASKQRRVCLLAVSMCPGHTAAEIARMTGLERHAPSRRLPELRDGGLVKNGEARRCQVVGSNCLTWYPELAGDE